MISDLKGEMILPKRYGIKIILCPDGNWERKPFDIIRASDRGIKELYQVLKGGVDAELAREYRHYLRCTYTKAEVEAVKECLNKIIPHGLVRIIVKRALKPEWRIADDDDVEIASSVADIDLNIDYTDGDILNLSKYKGYNLSFAIKGIFNSRWIAFQPSIQSG